MKKMKKMLLASVLAGAMAFGAVTPSIAAMAESLEPKTIKNYVAFGDSMTNGYGFAQYNMDEKDMATNAIGYEQNKGGFADETEGFDGYGFQDHSVNYYNQLYPFLVEQQLEDLHKDWDVQVYQYAIAAMRPEELHFLLTLDTEKDYSGMTDEEVAAYLKSTGDAYMTNCWMRRWLLRRPELRDPEPIPEPVPEPEPDPEKPLPIEENEFDIENSGLSEDLKAALKGTTSDPKPEDPHADIVRVQEVARAYQEATKKADYITVNLGSNSFFNFFLNEMFDIINGKNPTYAFNVAEQLYGEKPFIKETAEAMYSTVRKMLLGVIGSSNEGTIKLVEGIGGALVYAYVGMVKGYEKSLNDIISLSKNKVNISLLGLSNIFRGVKATLGGMTLDLGDIVGVFISGVSKSFEKIANEANKKVALRINKPYKVSVVSQFIDENGKKSDKVGTFYDNYANNAEKGLQIINDKILDDYIPTAAKSIWPAIKGAFPEAIQRNYYAKSSKFPVYKLVRDGELTGRIGLTAAIYQAYEKASLSVCKDEVNGVRTFSLDYIGSVLGGSVNVNNFKAEIESIFEGTGAIIDNTTINDAFDFSTVVDDIAAVLTKYEDVRLLIYVYNNYLGGSRAIHPDEDGHAAYARAIVASFEPQPGVIGTVVNNTVKAILAPFQMLINFVKNVFNFIFIR